MYIATNMMVYTCSYEFLLFLFCFILNGQEIKQGDSKVEREFKVYYVMLTHFYFIKYDTDQADI